MALVQYIFLPIQEVFLKFFEYCVTWVHQHQLTGWFHLVSVWLYCTTLTFGSFTWVLGVVIHASLWVHSFTWQSVHFQVKSHFADPWCLELSARFQRHVQFCFAIWLRSWGHSIRSICFIFWTVFWTSVPSLSLWQGCWTLSWVTVLCSFQNSFYARVSYLPESSIRAFSDCSIFPCKDKVTLSVVLVIAEHHGPLGDMSSI